jgi:deoxyribodipyrimidine photo-lyase
MKLEAPVIVWFRHDLRVADNPALRAAAAEANRPIVPLYILDQEIDWPPGGATLWWLDGSLKALSADLAALGAPLSLRRGPAEKILRDVVRETGATAVYWNRHYAPGTIARDKAIKAGLQKIGVTAESFNGALLFEPWELKTQAGNPFKVFTPFWRTAMNAPAPRKPFPAPKKLVGFTGAITSEKRAAWKLLPTKPDWAGGMRENWTPGEAGARALLHTFHDENVTGYIKRRDLPGETGTSRLSPHLAFGEISPHQIWHAANRWEPGAGQAGFMRQIIWREFCTHLLYHFPQIPEAPLRREFAAFPWAKDKKALRAWQQGRTGYPIVDAGMRELWHTGWMHNRVRMVVASFLVKHLLLPWRAGEDWFWDTLVDADLANNAANWQWVAGCGTDAAPYFRVFNPVLQGEKFDADGAYVRRWVPEIAALDDAWIHKPWGAPDSALEMAGIVLGKTYPAPIVDHKAARDRALAAFKQIRTGED